MLWGSKCSCQHRPLNIQRSMVSAMMIVLHAFCWVDSVSDSVSNVLTHGSGLNKFNISVISYDLDLFVPYA